MCLFLARLLWQIVWVSVGLLFFMQSRFGGGWVKVRREANWGFGVFGTGELGRGLCLTTRFLATSFGSWIG